MTDEQINAAIAKACGWTSIVSDPCLGVMGIPPAKNECDPVYVRNCMWTEDLNAMHEAEKVLTDSQFLRYSRWIESFMQSPEYRSYLSASARQRAEAFLRTIGKWEETRND